MFPRQILHDALPTVPIARIKLRPRVWDRASVVCMDIMDFEYVSNKLMPGTLGCTLGEFYAKVDKLSLEHAIDKVDLTGNGYIAVASSAEEAVRFCLDASDLAKVTLWDSEDLSQGHVILRCAVHTGRVTGIVLESASYKYTLVGDAVVLAKKLQSEAVPGYVHCSSVTAELLKDGEFHVVCQSPVDPWSYAVTNSDANCKTVICPTSLRFISISDSFVELFGFSRRELLTLRMLYGPNTRITAVQHALDQCYQFNSGTRTVVILYDRHTKEMCISIEMETVSDVLMGVAMACSVLTDGPTRHS